MLIDVADRGTGKTVRALEWLAASPHSRALVTPYHRNAMLLAQQIYTVPVAQRWHIVDLGMLDRLRGTSVREFWIDDLGEMIRCAIPLPSAELVGASITGAILE